MNIVEPGFEIVLLPAGDLILAHIEKAARICYKSEDKIGPGSAENLVKRIVHMGHESVIEHATATVRITCDRGVSHELVRHRLASFSQESTRYANYAQDRFGREITVIRPFFWNPESEAFRLWMEAMQTAEQAYLALVDAGATAQEARSVLPNSLKTEIVITANLREWRHIFRLRCAKASHPQMRQIMLPLLAEFSRRIPVLFDDLWDEFGHDLNAFGPLLH
ncbi:MAG: FAD-dependent thymidylate synthase [Deltaproteobacteria bacterium]|nr:FAD-dependent thymidylate synthase [Deltaproteobacteria bacterium]